MDQADYKSKIDLITEQLRKPIWLTEVDFDVDSVMRADKVEELMRTCFAHPNVGGIVLWVWWEGRRWRESLSSFLVDSSFVENGAGIRWRKLRDQWKTTTSGTTDASGNFAFTGFHGKYVAQMVDGEKFYADTFYLEPGTDSKTVEVNLTEVEPFPIRNLTEFPSKSISAVSFRLNGRTIRLHIPSGKNSEIFLTTYSISGKQLYREVVNIESDVNIAAKLPSGCHVFRIGTVNRTLYTGLDLRLR
jgi:hypothetical protein